eukprot:SAG22_NODE_20093_length_268_cov_1.485207_2_plen_52_part_01
MAKVIQLYPYVRSGSRDYNAMVPASWVRYVKSLVVKCTVPYIYRMYIPAFDA